MEYAVKLKPGLLEARVDLGRALVKKGRADDAIRILEVAILIDGSNAPVRKELSLALLAKGRRAEAVTNLVYALELRPDFPEAKEELRKLTNSWRAPRFGSAGSNTVPVGGRRGAK